MASNYQGNSGISSNAMFGGAVVAFIAVLFAAIVLWPSGSAPSVPAIDLSETALGQQLPDQETKRYLAVLHRVDPKAAKRLISDADSAYENGADQDEVATLVLAASGSLSPDDFAAMLRADISHMNAITGLMQKALAITAKRAPQYCKPANFMRFETMDPDAVVEELAGLFSYESQAYTWAIKGNRLLLEAIENGKRYPKKYGKLTDADQQELQKVMLRLMQSRNFTQLARLQTLSKADQEAAAMQLNACEIGAELLSSFNRLPDDTKERLMGEAQRQIKSGKFKKQLRQMQSRS